MKKIAFAGIAHIHAPTFLKWVDESEFCSFAGIWDHDRARAEKAAAQYGCRVYDSADAIWTDSEANAVVVTSETDRHGELVSCAAAAKKHLFVEKPVGFSAADAKKTAALVEQAGILFQTGYFMRGNPICQFLKRQVEAGAFGQITRVRHANCHAGSLGGWFDGDYRWMADPAIAGCGAFGDLGTHSLDLLMWMFGRPERVTGRIRTVTARYGQDCDESGEALLEFPNGVLGTLAGAWVDISNPVSCEICGTEGHAVVFNDRLYFESSHVPGADGKTPWTELPEARPHAFIGFLNALNGDANAQLVSVREAADRSIVMEAVYRTAADGGSLRVQY